MQAENATSGSPPPPVRDRLALEGESSKAGSAKAGATGGRATAGTEPAGADLDHLRHLPRGATSAVAAAEQDIFRSTGSSAAQPRGGPAVMPPLGPLSKSEESFCVMADAFRESAGRDRVTHAMRFTRATINELCRLQSGVCQGVKAAYQAQTDDIARQERTDRSLGNSERKKKGAGSRAETLEKLQSVALAEPTCVYARLRAELLPVLAFMMEQAMTPQLAQIGAECTDKLQQQWQAVQPMFTSPRASAIAEASRGHGTRFMEALDTAVGAIYLPPMVDLPVHLRSPSSRKEPPGFDGLHEDLMEDLRWLERTFDVINQSLAGGDWMVPRFMDGVNSCREFHRAIRMAVDHALQAASRLTGEKVPGIDDKLSALNAVLERLREDARNIQEAPDLSEEEKVSMAPLIMEAFLDLASCITGLHDSLLGMIPFIKSAGEFEAAERTRIAEQERAGRDDGPHAAGGATAAASRAWADADSGESAGGVDIQDDDDLSLDREDEGIEQRPDNDNDNNAAARAALVPPRGERPRGPKGAGADACSSRTAAGSTASAATPGRPQRHAALATAPPVWEPPNFRTLPLAGTAAVLDRMRGNGRLADAQVLCGIGRRMMGAELSHMSESTRAGLLKSLLPHLNACTTAPDAVTFPTLLSFLRAAGASQSRELRFGFSAAVAENFGVMREGPKEIWAFNEFVLDGGAFELLQHMRWLSTDDARSMFGKLLRFFRHAEESISPRSFAEALDLRCKGEESVDGKLQVSLARVLAGLLENVKRSSDSRKIAQCIAGLHGRVLPGELVASSSPLAWQKHALEVFMGGMKALPCHFSKGKIVINVHNAGMRLLRWLMEMHFEGRLAPAGAPVKCPLFIIVGGYNHPPLSVSTLRQVVADLAGSHKGWVVSEADSITLKVEWQPVKGGLHAS